MIAVIQYYKLIFCLTYFTYQLDCKTVGFFFSKSVVAQRKNSVRVSRARSSRVSARIFIFSPQARSLFSDSLQNFCLTVRAYLNRQKYGLFCSLPRLPINLVVQTYYWRRQWKTDFASFQTFSGLFQLVKSVKIQENKLELKTRNGVRAQRDTVKLNALALMFLTELKLWSFQVVVVQDGGEMQRLA